MTGRTEDKSHVGNGDRTSGVIDVNPRLTNGNTSGSHVRNSSTVSNSNKANNQMKNFYS